MTYQHEVWSSAELESSDSESDEEPYATRYVNRSFLVISTNTIPCHHTKCTLLEYLGQFHVHIVTLCSGLRSTVYRDVLKY